MTTLALIGAGPGLGLAVARRFGTEGHAIALISRSQENLDALAATLAQEGITAQGFAADVRDADALRGALNAAAAELGPIEVLQYSPVPAKDSMKPVLETAAEDLVGPVEQAVYGPVTAVQTVLPGLRELGRGTILFINGGSGARPSGGVAGTSIAFAGESAYGAMLHEALVPEDIHVAQLIIPFGIGGGEPSHEPEALADQIWSLHTERGPYRTFVEEMDGV
jgi:NADP-dependent 3-hydroxy acid dehydrogenase YdfG